MSESVDIIHDKVVYQYNLLEDTLKNVDDELREEFVVLLNILYDAIVQRYINQSVTYKSEIERIKSECNVALSKQQQDVSETTKSQQQNMLQVQKVLKKTEDQVIALKTENETLQDNIIQEKKRNRTIEDQKKQLQQTIKELELKVNRFDYDESLQQEAARQLKNRIQDLESLAQKLQTENDQLKTNLQNPKLEDVSKPVVGNFEKKLLECNQETAQLVLLNRKLQDESESRLRVIGIVSRYWMNSLALLETAKLSKDTKIVSDSVQYWAEIAFLSWKVLGLVIGEDLNIEFASFVENVSVGEAFRNLGKSLYTDFTQKFWNNLIENGVQRNDYVLLQQYFAAKTLINPSVAQNASSEDVQELVEKPSVLDIPVKTSMFAELIVFYLEPLKQLHTNDFKILAWLPDE